MTSYQKQISSSSLSSADNIACNDDIIMEILLRLPAKSVLKLKLVSRRWLYLISDPNFVVRHCRQNAKIVSGFILACVLFFKMPPTYMHVSLDENQNSTQGQAVHLSFDPCAPGSIMISQSCNGLLLCYSQRYGSPAPCRHYIFSPATNRFSIIPEPIRNKFSIDFFSLAYDPTISPFYLVVCVQFYKSSCNVQIYSSETQIWRNARNHDFGSFSIQFRHGVFWNGGIHWINPYDGNSSRFDIEQETLQAMPRPPLPEDWNCNNFRHFMESQGDLFFIDFDSPEYIIYQMEKDCSKWIKKHHLDINLIVTAYPDITEIKENSSNSLLESENFISLVSLVEVKNEGPSLVMYVPGRFISYGLKGNTFKTLRDVLFHDSKRFQWLAGKVVVITEGAIGIGASTACLFHENGAKVVIADIQDNKGEALANKLEESVCYIHYDIRNLTVTAITKHGKLDIMYSNAGVMDRNLSIILDATESETDQVIGVNLVGGLLGAKHAARGMVPQGKGCILFTTSACTAIAGLLSGHGYAV
ncbi:hypothetical protein CRYUN_Cryun08bG0120900 [Craigia yunnanensis]